MSAESPALRFVRAHYHTRRGAPAPDVKGSDLINGTVAAFAKAKELQPQLDQLAGRLGLPVLEQEPSNTGAGDPLVLCLDRSGLCLMGGDLTVQGDFTRMLPRLKAGRLQQELLVRAAKLKHTAAPTAVDATAGLGEDALLLAAAGFSIQLFEYNPIIAALLQDALARARTVPELSGIVQRMQASHADSITALPQLPAAPDLVLLDPMFPARKKSALVKKKFQLLQRLEQPCLDENELLQAAVAARPRKIVIKRPANGPYLAGVKPSYSIQGKGIRYDCLVLPERAN